jgi:hypothetical protein
MLWMAHGLLPHAVGGTFMMNRISLAIGAAMVAGMLIPPTVVAQDRDRDYDRDRDRDRITRIEPGTIIPVRTNQSIESDRDDGRTFVGTVDQDVRSENGRLAIPRGAEVQMHVRVTRDNDLVLDLDSIRVRGENYTVRTDPNRVESRRDDSLVGSIVGAINGQARGREVRVPRDTILAFRLERPLVIGDR